MFYTIAITHNIVDSSLDKSLVFFFTKKKTPIVESNNITHIYYMTCSNIYSIKL
jgi:hypothetical protein